MADIIGKIKSPILNNYDTIQEGGFNDFVSNALALLATVGGILVFVNFIVAGYQYLSANGNAQVIASAGNKILQSLIGLVIIVTAFILATIIGLVFFGDATYLISPTFTKI